MYTCVSMLMQGVTVNVPLLSLAEEQHMSTIHMSGAYGCMMAVCYQRGPPMCA